MFLGRRTLELSWGSSENMILNGIFVFFLEKPAKKDLSFVRTQELQVPNRPRDEEGVS